MPPEEQPANGQGTQQQQPAGAAPANGAQQPAPQQTEHERELDRLRNQAGQERRAREAAETELNTLRNASKTELEKLQEKAAKADQLEADNKRYQATLTAEVEARKATLPEAMRDLLPAGTPDQQLDWIRKATEAAGKLAPAQQQQQLPAAGNRNPAGGGQSAEAIKKDQAVATYPTLRGRRFQ